jgi:hypothetical protein
MGAGAMGRPQQLTGGPQAGLSERPVPGFRAGLVSNLILNFQSNWNL